MEHRLQRLRQRLAEEGLDVLMVSQPANRRYLSGFTGSAGTLFIGHSEALLYTDFRYWTQARQQAPTWELVKQDDSLKEEIAPILSERLKVGRVGFEAHALSYQSYRDLSQAVPGVEWVPLTDWVEDLRVVKEPEELDRIRQAARLTDLALGHLRQRIRPGMTEAEGAWIIEAHMRQQGGEPAFETIVASGPNGALAHYRPGGRPIQAGEPIVVDLGARLEGYCADLTRTWVLGPPDGRFLEIHGIVSEAQARCVAGTRAGMEGQACDALTREPISQAGHGESFGHGTGHGVGLEVHERPRAGKRSEEVLQAGSTLTIEPGIYLEDWGGVRIEDLVVVGPEGVEVLSAASKDPTI